MQSKLALWTLALPALLFSTLIHQPSTSFAQGTAITYQGRLDDASLPAGGIYDLRFTIYDSAGGGGVAGGPLTNSPGALSNGLFTATLDFGPGVFNGAGRWLEIGVRTNGGGTFSTLTPRQAITPSPYAVYAAKVPAAGLTGILPSGALVGIYGNGLVFSSSANSFTGNGAGLTGVNAATLGGRPSSGFWQLGGNADTTPGADFIGTTDSQPLELRVGGRRGFRLEPVADDSYLTNRVNVIAGSPDNTVEPGVYGATIAGGGAGSDGALTYSNSVAGDFGSVGGGAMNRSGPSATVAGGFNNIADGSQSTVGGGSNNRNFGFIGTIGGGTGNLISFSQAATIGGGEGNEILYGGHYATIPGGFANSATNYAFAAGRRAKADHTGAFVWADSQNADFNSTASNQFLVRAAGGVGIGTTSPTAALAIASPAGGQTLDVAGSRSGNFSSPVAYIQNANGSGNSGPALRLLGQGNAVDGVLNVGNTGTGKIIAFGAAGGEVANLDTNGSFSFGTATRQMLNLWGTVYGVGVQNNTFYTRSDGGFAWFNKGAHSNSANDPGAGGTALMALDSAGNLRTLTGTLSTLSDRNAKTNFEAVDARDVLERVAALPISRWNFKNAPATQRHMGPMAQDFHAAFNIGLEATGICTVDADGVALAAIQGLNEKVESGKQKAEKRIEKLEAENTELKQRLERLERLMSGKNGGGK